MLDRAREVGSDEQRPVIRQLPRERRRSCNSDKSAASSSRSRNRRSSVMLSSGSPNSCCNSWILPAKLPFSALRQAPSPSLLPSLLPNLWPHPLDELRLNELLRRAGTSYVLRRIGGLRESGKSSLTLLRLRGTPRPPTMHPRLRASSIRHDEGITTISQAVGGPSPHYRSATHTSATPTCGISDRR